MMDMEKKREKLVVGLARRHMIRSGSSPSPPTTATDSNRNESGSGDYNAAFRQKKGKAKASKWRSSNNDLNGKGDAQGSDGDCDDTVLSSLTKASFSSLISRKRVRTLGKVAEDCDAVDPPVPRKLRSVINKRAGRTVSSSPRHVNKRRHLSAISTQTFFMDRETRFNESSLSNCFTKEEEVVADALLSLSQTPPLCELTADKAMAEDISNINVASTSCSEGAIKEDDKITVLPSAPNEAATQPARSDQPVERNGIVPQVNPVRGATHNNINPPLSKDGQIQELSLGIVTNSPSPSKDSNNSARKELKVQFDDSPTYPAKTEAPRWLVNSNKPDFVVHDGEKAKNNSAQEIVPSVQTPLPCTSHGYLIKPSTSTLAALTNAATETNKASATGNNDKLSLVKNGGPTKTWKRSITHVYVSHLIQMHLNKDKASQNRVKPEERSHNRTSRSPNGSALNKNNVQDERFYAVHFDVRLPVQPSSGICDTNAGQRKMVSGDFLNLPTSAALPGAQHVQYLHPQITPRGAMPYPFPHLPYSRGNVAPAPALQQMPHYMCKPGYAPRPSLPANPAVMKLQQRVPTTQQQQQQMWQFHFPQYQPQPDATAPAAWQNSRLQDMSSLRAMPVLPPPPAMLPQMELFCAPYQGGSRQPPQLRLI